MARTSGAAMAYREALLGGLEKILEKNHRRLVLEMQQWLGEHQAMNSSEIHEEDEKPEREKRDSAGSDSRKEKVSTCSESLPFSLTASQVALISPSRVSSMERSGYHVAKQVSVPSFAAPSVAASEAEPRLCERRWRLLEKAVSSWQFEAFFAVVIATNSLFIGLSIEWEAQERTFTLPTELFVIQIAYTVLFLAEVCLKLLAFGARDFFCSSGWAWNCFDLAIVMSAVFECTVEFVAHDPHLSAGSSSNLRILRILRMTRLTRIFRVIRVVRFFRSLRTLVFSIVNTLKSLFWAMLLLAMIMYVFGILFTDISNNHIIESGTPEAESIIKLEKYFGTLHDSVHTLFMSISGGLTWMDATMALAAVSWVWKYVFSCYIAFSVFAVLNVMTGVFCQSAIKGAERDQEMVVQSLIMDKHQLKNSLEKLFQKMDDEKSGKLSLANFEKHFQDEEVRVLFEALDIGVTDAWTLFLSLDHNEDYQIEAEEFLEGCLQLRGAAKAIDLFMLRRQVAKLMLVLSEPEETLREKTACLEVETCM